MTIHRMALLDVDQTLLYNQDDMNDALIDVLVENGVNEVYLFTNMGLSDITCYGREGAPFSRINVIDYLVSKGLSVNGVITPADPYFSGEEQVVGAAYQRLYRSLMKKRIEQQRPLDITDYSSEDALEYLFSKLQWDVASYTLREANRLAPREHKNISKPGLCLANRQTGRPDTPLRFIADLDEATSFFITGPEASTHRESYILTQGAYPAESDIEIFENTYASSDPKGAMMAHLLQKSGLIQSNTQIYYFDDRLDHLQAVAASMVLHNKLDNVALHTCLVPTELANAMHPSQKAAYQACLNGATINSLPTLVEPTPIQAQTDISASFLLSVLAHPATKIVAAVLILAGLVGLVFGGLGLAGIATGLSILAPTTLTGVSTGTILIGVSLGAAGFFSSKQRDLNQSFDNDVVGAKEVNLHA